MAMQYRGYSSGRGGSGGPISRALGGGRVGSTGLFDSILKNRPMMGRGSLQRQGPPPGLGGGLFSMVPGLFGLMGRNQPGKPTGGIGGPPTGINITNLPGYTPTGPSYAPPGYPTGDPRPPVPPNMYGGPQTVLPSYPESAGTPWQRPRPRRGPGRWSKGRF
jgi:hypothetical protein